MMRPILFVLALLVFSEPSYAAGTSALPKNFLGQWAPLSKTAGLLGIDIKEGGTVYRTDSESKKVQDIISYRFVRMLSGNHFSYIAVQYKNALSRKLETSIWQMSIQEDDLYASEGSRHEVLFINDCSYALSNQAFSEMKTKEIESVMIDKCDFRQDPYSGDLVTYSRKSPITAH